MAEPVRALRRARRRRPHRHGRLQLRRPLRLPPRRQPRRRGAPGAAACGATSSTAGRAARATTGRAASSATGRPTAASRRPSPRWGAARPGFRWRACGCSDGARLGDAELEAAAQRNSIEAKVLKALIQCGKRGARLLIRRPPDHFVRAVLVQPI